MIQINDSVIRLNRGKRMSQFNFFLVATITIMLYFELFTQGWFLQLSGGLLIRSWIPPLLLFFFVIIKRVIRKEDLFHTNFMNVMLLLYVIFALITLLMHDASLFLVIKHYLVMISPVLFYVVIVDSFRNNRDIKLMIYILFVSSVLLVIYTLLMQQLGIGIVAPVIIEGIQNTTTIELSEASYYESGQSFSRGLVGYEIGKYCGMISPFIIFSILFFFQSGSKLVKYFLSGFGFLFVYVVLQSMSRSGIISMLIGVTILIYFLFINEKGKRIKIFFLFACLSIGFSLYVAEYNMIAIRRFLQLFNFWEIGFLDNYNLLFQDQASVLSIDPHVQSIFDTMAAFYQSPLIGHGYIYAQDNLHEHNRYLFILASAGLLTLIPYFIFLIRQNVAINNVIKKYKIVKSQGLNYSYFFSACSFMFLFKLLNEQQETFYYWIIISLSVAWIQNIRIDYLHDHGNLLNKT